LFRLNAALKGRSSTRALKACSTPRGGTLWDELRGLKACSTL
jgi:hypothetical protein